MNDTPSPSSRHGFDEAWMILAIGRAGMRRRWRSVEKLVASADAINHAIPSHRQMGCGLAHLMELGFVESDARAFRLTVAGRGLLRATKAASVFEQWDRLELVLRKRPRLGHLTPGVDAQTYNDAVRAYLGCRS